MSKRWTHSGIVLKLTRSTFPHPFQYFKLSSEPETTYGWSFQAVSLCLSDWNVKTNRLGGSQLPAHQFHPDFAELGIKDSYCWSFLLE
ncbi:hypothetical protein LINPERHAP1_LOCUS39705 [Linum perenne]